MRLFFFSILVLFFTSACFYDSEENLFPSLPGGCDTTLVAYSLDIQPLLESDCYDCHSNLNAASLGNNLKLEDFIDVSNQSALVLKTIKHDAGVSPMPKGGTRLNYCDRLKIEAWINQGKLEN